MTTQTTETPPKNDKNELKRFVTEDENGIRLDRWFKRQFPHITHGQLQKWLRTGQIRLNGKRAESSTHLESGQILRLPPPLLSIDPLTNQRQGSLGHPMRDAEKLKSMILYEDEDVLVLNKPAGLAVQGGTGLKENLDDSLMSLSLDGITRPKLVHRLDKDTSGALLIARNDFAAAKLSASFRARSTQKIYWALTKRVPRPHSGCITASLIKRGQLMCVATENEEAEAKYAQTFYQTIDSMLKKLAFVALMPVTGRTHQLRVHMAHMGTPILGDTLYMGEENEQNPIDLTGLDLGVGLHLHARQIIIQHPRKGTLNVTAPLSVHMRKTWKCLNFSEKANVSFEEE